MALRSSSSRTDGACAPNRFVVVGAAASRGIRIGDTRRVSCFRCQNPIFHRISRSSSYAVASSSVPVARRPLLRRYAPRSFSIALTIGSGSRQPGRGTDRREWARRPRVARAARDLVEDIGRGFGISAALVDAPGRVDRPAVPVGTLAVIEALVNAGKLDVAPIVDRWESSALHTVPDPSRPSASNRRTPGEAGRPARHALHGATAASSAEEGAGMAKHRGTNAAGGR